MYNAMFIHNVYVLSSSGNILNISFPLALISCIHTVDLNTTDYNCSPSDLDQQCEYGTGYIGRLDDGLAR